MDSSIKKYISLVQINWLKILGCCLFLSLLIWLAVSPSSTESRWEEISNELKKGSIGKITKQQDRLLKETLTWLIAQVGIKEGYILNHTHSLGKLHIFITTPAAYSVTGCSRGNALYDAQIDAIFIDEQIINPKEITNLGGNFPDLDLSVEEFTFIPIYLRFIVLHELGHRQLHRKSGGAFFDFNSGSRQMEAEADSFAIMNLKLAYKSDIMYNKGNNIGKGAEQYIQLDSLNIRNSEKVWVDLLGTFSSMSTFLLYSASDFSSYYEDLAHPNFIIRATSIYKAALEDKEIGSELKARAAVYLRYLNRISSLSKLHFSEIQLPEGSQQVTYTKDELVVLSNQGSVLSIPIKTIEKALTNSNKPIQLRLNNKNKIDVNDNPIILSMCKLWAHPEMGGVILQPPPNEESSIVQSYSFKHATLTKLTSLQSTLSKDRIGANLFRSFNPWWKGGTDYDKDVFLPPQPASIAILQNGNKSPKELLLLLEGNVSHRINLDTIRTLISHKLNINSLFLDISTVTNNVAYISVFERYLNHDQLIAIAELNLLTATLGQILKFNLVDKDGYEMSSIINDKLIVIPGQYPRCILFTRNRTHFLVFELFSEKPVKLLGKTSFLLDSVLFEQNINSDVLASFDPILRKATFIPPNYAVASFDNDSVYLIELSTGQIITLFSPGNFLKYSVCENGLIAFYVNNGRKIYIFKASNLL